MARHAVTISEVESAPLAGEKVATVSKSMMLTTFLAAVCRMNHLLSP
jgi:hypothetical protein